jgi:hypothetical protein
VAKKSKNKAEKQTSGQEPDAGSTGANTTPKPRQKKATTKKKTVPAIKPAAARPAAAKQASSTAASSWEPSDEEIRTRAYFIAERRFQLSLAGDSDHDWIEARRQLIEEAGRKSS